MPSHKIHIKIAELVNEKFDLDLNLIMIGSVLPDLIQNIPHFKSHFKTEANNHFFYNKEMFIEKYLNKNKNNPVLIGYLIHLLTDEFYNNYFKKYQVYNDNKKLIGAKMKNGYTYYDSSEEICTIKQNEFFLYDKYLLMNMKLPLFNCPNITEKIPLIEECDFSKEYIYKYMQTYNNMVIDYRNRKDNINYKIMSQDELDILFSDCIKHIIDYIKNIL